MNANGSCAECKFFLALDSTAKDGIGECHRNPPRTDALLLGVANHEGKPIPQFSMVVVPARTHVTNWCGEFLKGLVIPKAGDLGKLGMKGSG